MKSNILVRRPNELSRSWAQSILSHYAAEGNVSDVKILSVNIGTTTRFRIRVNHDLPEIIPLNWFVKTPSMAVKPRLITTLPGLLNKEVHFYKSLSNGFPVKLPRILAAQSRFGRGSILVMSDLAELGFRPGQPADALSIYQARQVIEHLAQFHSHYWASPNLLKTHRWLGGFSSRAENHLGSLLAVPLMKRGLYLAGKLIPDKLHYSALRYAANRRVIMKSLAEGALTLVHHDCHPGNLFWTDSEPGFLDWQLVRMGEGIGDIAYFLATALDPECRRANEKQLLELYLASLAKNGIQGLDERRLYQRYRAHLSYPFEAMVLTLAVGGMMEQAGNLELIGRASAAVEDHDSFGALAV